MNFQSYKISDTKIDANCIVSGLYQGSVPSVGRDLYDAGFTAAVFSATEYQPSPGRYPGIKTLNVPLDDHDPTLDEKKMAVEASERVAREVRSGGRVLVTCMLGRNRSGLIVALSLMRLCGWNGDQAVRHIQARRQNALTNSHFVRFLKSIGSR